MPVITLSREMGSGGDDLARGVADRLGLRLVGRELINRAAKEAGAPEVALAEIDELGLLGVKPSAAARALYRQKITDVILELAAQGDVLIVGRGGQAVLANRPGVLHVRVSAPLEQRIQFVAVRCGISPEAAAARVAASDAARTGYHKQHFGVRWDDLRAYDLALNLVHLDAATAVDLVCLAAERLSRTAEGAALQETAGGCECR